MTDLDRRRVLGLLASAPAALAWRPADVLLAGDRLRAARQAAVAAGAVYGPRFFTAHEYRTVRVLVDLILPADERSGSATDAGVPEFMDFMMTDQERQQVPMRGGLAWVDIECRERYGAEFVDCASEQQHELLGLLAWGYPDASDQPEELDLAQSDDSDDDDSSIRPTPLPPVSSLSHGIAFFNRFRDLTATGFWTTEMGITDLQYDGNRFTRWRGCPDEQLRKLGLIEEA